MEATSLIIAISLGLSIFSFIICLILLAKRNKEKSNKPTDLESNNVSNVFGYDEKNPFKPTASPYYIRITNVTDEVQKCNLFGLGENILRENYGSDFGIKIEMGSSGVSYLLMLMQSGFMPFEIGLIHLKTKNAKQLIDNRIDLTSKDANGQMCQIPVRIDNYINSIGVGVTIDVEGNKLGEDDYKTVEIHYPIRIDVNVNLSLDIQPYTELIAVIYPTKKVNLSRALNDSDIHNKYAEPKRN